ncbi:MAG: hypothetical protein WCC10_10540, partial [Tumebacillaceae bacterium]
MRYALEKTIAYNPYFGNLSSARSTQNGRPVILLEVPSHMATLLGQDAIHLRFHPFQDSELPVLCMLEIFQSDDSVYIVHESVPDAVPLLDYLQDRPLNETLDVLTNLSEQLAFLHSRMLWVGAIVPEYVFVLPSGDVRLIPFYANTPLDVFNT